jgi:hypothetical protein
MRASYPKYVVRLVGANLSAEFLYRLQALVNHMKLGRWMRQHGFSFRRQVADRWAVFDVMAERIGNQAVLYLEFGAFKGRTTKYWAAKLTNPDTRLIGFDSFEGLPEEWAGREPGRIFNAEGQIPIVADPRVTFVKGWFDRVLPTFEIPGHTLLVLILDADLYSSTTCVFQKVREYIRPGTLVYFDELNHVEHEPRAFHELMEQGFRFSPVVADRTLTHACWESY